MAENRDATKIIDVSFNCTVRAKALAAAGVETVIRYYSRDTTLPTKQITPTEAAAHAAAGLRLGIVYEGRFGNKPENFDRATGIADGRYALDYAAASIGQPAGSAIYFAVDFDASAAELSERVLPYFQGIADAGAARPGGNPYRLGIYGSGAACKAVLDAGLVQLAWLAQAKGWAGYSAFLKSNRWAIRQEMPAQVAGVDCDPDVAATDFGDFLLPRATATVEPAADSSPAPVMQVNARSGLNLRAGPGLDFSGLRLLARGTTVHALKIIEGWTQVDLQGDGIADGFVSSAFLTAGDDPSAQSSSPVAVPLVSGDAVHVAELIRLGASESGLKRARALASASLPGYPTNGCAAHLSALLQLAGIDVPLTWGAGKLAQRLRDRNWRKIAVGAQQPGDAGVCFDNNPNPPGADHVYLVIETHGTDEMLIADNQNPANAPHIRFASGLGGKTETEYFLRA